MWRKTYEDRKRVVYGLTLDCWPSLVAYIDGIRPLKGKRPRARFWKRSWISQRRLRPKGCGRISARRLSFDRLCPARTVWTFGLEVGEGLDGPYGYCSGITLFEAMFRLEDWILANAPSRHAKAVEGHQPGTRRGRRRCC